MVDIIEYTDGQRITEDGHQVRFMLPTWRHGHPVTGGVCTDRISGSRRVRTFNVQSGDTTSDDARVHAGHLKTSPARAMAVFDTSRSDVRHPGQLTRASFVITVHPGQLMTHDWCGICQYNARPSPGERWRVPPVAVGVKPRAPHSREEVFYVELATFPDPGSQEQGHHVDLGPRALVPLKRDRPYAVALEFLDGAGGKGLLKVRINDTLIVDYAGPTGYANFAGNYFAYGLYRSPWCPGSEGLAADFEKVVEAPAA